jgi:hypothetical protein
MARYPAGPPFRFMLEAVRPASMPPALIAIFGCVTLIVFASTFLFWDGIIDDPPTEAAAVFTGWLLSPLTLYALATNRPMSRGLLMMLACMVVVVLVVATRTVEFELLTALNITLLVAGLLGGTVYLLWWSPSVSLYYRVLRGEADPREIDMPFGTDRWVPRFGAAVTYLAEGLFVVAALAVAFLFLPYVLVLFAVWMGVRMVRAWVSSRRRCREMESGSDGAHGQPRSGVS